MVREWPSKKEKGDALDNGKKKKTLGGNCYFLKLGLGGDCYFLKFMGDKKR